VHRQPHAGLLGHGQDALQEEAKVVPERLLGHRPLAGRRRVGEQAMIVRGDLRVTATWLRHGRAQPAEHGHPVVTEHRNREAPHAPQQGAEVLDLLLAPGLAEADAVHRRVVLDYDE
jgi:hypothetical protein